MINDPFVPWCVFKWLPHISVHTGSSVLLTEYNRFFVFRSRCIQNGHTLCQLYISTENKTSTESTEAFTKSHLGVNKESSPILSTTTKQLTFCGVLSALSGWGPNNASLSIFHQIVFVRVLLTIHNHRSPIDFSRNKWTWIYSFKLCTE